MTKTKLMTLAAAALMLSLPMTSANAYVAGAVEGQQITENSAAAGTTVSDEKIAAFTAAYNELKGMSAEGMSPEDIHKAQTAVVEKHGLSLEEYATINREVQLSPALQQRVMGQ